MRLRLVAGAAATIVMGLVWRLVPLGMAAGVVKYGGSALWAVMVYLLVAAVWPAWRGVRVGVVAMTVATAVELFKLVPGARLDAFRTTLAGKLLLGKYFSVWDLVAYAVAILIVAGGFEWGGVRRQVQLSG